MPACEHSDVCGRDALDGHDGKCILHSEDPEKDEDAFEEALEKHREEHGPNFREVVFPMEVDFSDTTFENEVTFLNATLKDAGYFSNATFKEAADFRSTAFEGVATFTHTTFEDEVAVFGATFRDWVDFRSAVFEAGANFVGVVFKGESDFGSTTFGGVVDFADARFEAETDFRGATLEDEADFERAAFNDGADFRSTTFQSVFVLSESTFKDLADFRNTTFGGVATFSEATFEDVADFGNTTFENRADFLGLVFEAGAYFPIATFEDEANFGRSTFKGVADFVGATFEDEASFERVTFREADFQLATFRRAASFRRCFQTDEHAQFEEAKFDQCEFEGETVFTGRSGANRAFADGVVSFRDVVVVSDASLQFRYLDLSRCRFLHTDLRGVEFIGVKWCNEVSSDGRCFDEWFWRVGLYDEVYEQSQEDNSGEKQSDEEGTSPPWFEIERLYRQLKRNYEDRGDFPRAGNFHIGEKVARRQNPQTHWGAQIVLYAYRALSKYGERALPATFWLVGLVPVLALLYYLYGASTCTLCGPVSYPEALLSSIEATFYPVRPVGFEEKWAQFLSVVQRIISPILLALLALALRQRVKR